MCDAEISQSGTANSDSEDCRTEGCRAARDVRLETVGELLIQGGHLVEHGLGLVVRPSVFGEVTRCVVK